MTGASHSGLSSSGAACAPRRGPPATTQRAAATGSVPGLRRGPPPPAFVAQRRAVQSRPAPGDRHVHHAPTPASRSARRQAGSFEIDPVKIGLARNGGGAAAAPGVLAKMEAAFDADFSSVRVHVGPQASRIGAVAFTMGNDLYFAPGRYQPEFGRRASS